MWKWNEGKWAGEEKFEFVRVEYGKAFRVD